MNQTPIWEKIRERVKIPDLINLNDNKYGKCLIYGNETGTSTQYYVETELLHCHKCQKTFDVIDVYSVLNNITKSQAIKQMATEYNIPFDKYDEEHIAIQKQIEDLFIDFMEKCHNNPIFQNRYFFLTMKKRGFTKQTIKTFKIGLFDDTIKAYIENKYSKELLNRAGFINKKGNWSFNKRIVFPYLNQNNIPKYFIYRLIDSDPDFNKNAKYIKQYNTPYIDEIPFGLNSFYNTEKKELIITEGITDAISVIQARYPCLSPVTIRIKKKDIEKIVNYCRKFSRIIVINDNEKFKKYKKGDTHNPGLEGAKTTLKVLLKNKLNVAISIIPNPNKLEKIDLDDYLKPDLSQIDDKNLQTFLTDSLNEQTNKIKQLIDNSTEGFEFFLEQMNKESSKTDFYEIFELIPEDNEILKNRIFKILKTKTELNLSIIKTQFQTFLKEKKEENKKKAKYKKTQNEHTNNFEETIKSWDPKLNSNEMIYEFFIKIKNEDEETIDKLIKLMESHLYRYNENTLKRIKVSCEFDEIVDKLKINLDIEKITDNDIKEIILQIDARRTVILDALFIWFEIKLGIKEDRVKDALLPYIEETTKKIIEKYPSFILMKTENIYSYQNGVYIKQNKTPEDFLEEIILKEIPYNIKEIAGELKINRRIKIIAKEIIARIQIKEEKLNLELLNFKNGILLLEDIKNKKWKLRPHNPKYKSTIQFNVSFKPFINPSKKLKQFCIKQLGETQYNQLTQLYGAALTGTPYKWMCITFLHGPSGTGKSQVILKILEELVPKMHISRETFLSLIDHKMENFSSGSLLDSLLNIHGDIKDKALECPEGINALTEEYLSINKKYGYKGMIKNKCSHFYAMNVLPQIPQEDRIDIWKRIAKLKIIGNPVPENERDPDYFKKILEEYPNELSAILNEILMGLSYVLNEGRVNLPSILDRREIYREDSLPLLAFLMKWCKKYETNKNTKPNETYLIERHFFLKIYNLHRKEQKREKIENLWSLTDEEKKLPENYRLYRKQKGPNNFCYLGLKFTQEAIKHFKINLDEVKEKYIFYPEGTSYSKSQTRLNDLTSHPEYNEALYKESINLIEKDPHHGVYLDNIKSLLKDKGFNEDIIDINLKIFLKKKLFILTEENKLEFNEKLLEQL